MGKNYKIILLTVLTLSVLAIALIEMSGISKTALLNAFNGSDKKEAEQAASRVALVAAMPKTTMEFYEKKFSFGKQREGTMLKHTFRFKNTGTQPLMISKTDVSCGCTVPHFPSEPIAPGGEGDIAVEFNSSGKSGVQSKNILVHSNAELEAVSISIEADIN